MEELGEGAFSGTLADDSSNVVDLVAQLYNVSTCTHILAEQSWLFLDVSVMYNISQAVRPQ